MRQLDLFEDVENKKREITIKGKEDPGLRETVVPAQENIGVVRHSEFKPTEDTAPPKKSAKEVAIKKEDQPTGKRGRKSFKEMNADIVMVDVPGDEILFKKQYYSISEVAQWFHVNISLLRYWENEFDILKPRKTGKGDRLFRPEDVKNLQLIYFLLRHRKFSIEGAKQYMKKNKHKADKHMQIIQSLTKLRAFLLEWKSNLGA